MSSSFGSAAGARQPIDRTVGDRLRLAIELSGISKTIIADALKIDAGRLNQTLVGQVRLDPQQMIACAELLGFPVAWFFRDGPGGIRQEHR